MIVYPMGHLLCINKVIYDHVGISDGRGMVYENTKGAKPRIVSIDVFANGKNIKDLGILPGSFEPSEIIKRAQKIIEEGKRNYDLLSYNCEHFVREVCGVDITSPQVQKHIFTLTAGSVALLTKSTPVKVIAGGAAIVSGLSEPDNVGKNLITYGKAAAVATLGIEILKKIDSSGSNKSEQCNLTRS